MSDACTVIMQDRSYCLDGRYAGVIREATFAGATEVWVEVRCQCGSEHVECLQLTLADIVNVVHHGAAPRSDRPMPDLGNVIALPRR